MKKPAKIKKHMFDDILRAELEGKADRKDVRLKSEPISMDDIDENIKNKLNNQGTPGGTAYDDSELRHRIIDLEAVKDDVVKSKNAFDKTKDKVDRELLNGALKEGFDKTKKIDELEQGKADKIYVDETFRPIKKSIKEGDLDPDVVKKFNDMITDFYNLKENVGPLPDIAEELNDIKTSITELSDQKANTKDLNDYRNKNTLITQEDVDSSISTKLEDINVLKNKVLNELALKTDIESCRKSNEKISKEDLEPELSSFIDSMEKSMEGTQAQIIDTYEKRIRDDERAWILEYYGERANANSSSENPSNADKIKYIEPYSLRHNVADFVGTLKIDGNYSFASVINFLYHCMFNDRNTGMYFGPDKTVTWYSLPTLKEKIDNMNTSIGGFFSMPAAIKDLQERVQALEEEVAALKGDSNDEPTNS